MDSSGVGFLHHTEGAMGVRAVSGRGNLWILQLLAARSQPDVDVGDDLPRLATLGPALVPAVVAAFALFLQPAHGDALAPRGREDADDPIIPAAGPDDAVGARALHAVHRPAPRDEQLARQHHDLIHRHRILVLDRLGADRLRHRAPAPAV